MVVLKSVNGMFLKPFVDLTYTATSTSPGTMTVETDTDVFRPCYLCDNMTGLCSSEIPVCLGCKWDLRDELSRSNT